MPTLIPNVDDGASGGTAMEVQPKVEVQKEPVPFFNREPVVIMAFVRAMIYLAVAYGFAALTLRVQVFEKNRCAGGNE